MSTPTITCSVWWCTDHAEWVADEHGGHARHHRHRRDVTRRPDLVTAALHRVDFPDGTPVHAARIALTGGDLTPRQARKLAAVLLELADQAEATR